MATRATTPSNFRFDPRNRVRQPPVERQRGCSHTWLQFDANRRHQRRSVCRGGAVQLPSNLLVRAPTSVCSSATRATTPCGALQDPISAIRFSRTPTSSSFSRSGIRRINTGEAVLRRNLRWNSSPAGATDGPLRNARFNHRSEWPEILTAPVDRGLTTRPAHQTRSSAAGALSQNRLHCFVLDQETGALVRNWCDH